MRPWLSLKMLLRSPFKTILTFLLIAAASFALFSRVADYAVTSRETNHAVDYYRGVAALDNGVPNTALLLASRMPNSERYSQEINTSPSGLTAERIDAFSSLPGVSSIDIRYMTAGVIDSLERVVRYGDYKVKYDYSSRFVLEGTLADCTRMYGSEANDLSLTDCKLLAGDVPLTQGGDVSVVAYAKDGSNFGLTHGDMHIVYSLYNNPYGQSFTDSLAIGDRCLIIGRWASLLSSSVSRKDDDGTITTVTAEEALAAGWIAPEDIPPPRMYIGDQDTLDYVDSFWLLNNEPENYLETEKFSRVKEIIDITNRDIKTFDMVYTSDMLSIPRFNEGKMVIQEGRALTEADTNSCVVNSALMELNGLEIGDTITANLCDKLLMQHAGMGATAVIHDRYGAAVKTVQLEIVGAYTDADAQYERDAAEWWCYSLNTVFVPQSLLPVEVPADHPIYPGEFSVVIDDARQIQTFLDAAKPPAKEMGLTLKFSDRGWLEVADSVNIGQTASLITALLFLGAAAVALLLAVYLYIGRGKKNYAIMRALGAPRNKVRNTLALPLGMLSVLAIPAGGIVGLGYAQNASSTALENMAAVMENYVPDTSLPVAALIGCFVCEAAFLVLLTALFMRRLGKTSVLELLQGGGVPPQAMFAVGGERGLALFARRLQTSYRFPPFPNPRVHEVHPYMGVTVQSVMSHVIYCAICGAQAAKALSP